MDDESRRRLEILESCFAALAAQDADRLVTHYTPDYILELPYYKPNEPLVVRGRDAVHGYVTAIVARQRMELSLTNVHAIAAERLVIAEYKCTGEFMDTGEPYQNDYVGYWYFKGDRVCRLREYYNPQAPRASAID